MERPLYFYALVKTLLDRGEDYIDCFLPFVISVIPTNTFTNLENIQAEFSETFNVNPPPQHVLETILRRAKKKGYITRKRERSVKLYQLTTQGAEFVEKLEANEEAERRLNALVEDLRCFLKDHGIELSLEDARSLLETFIQQNLEPILEYINPYVPNVNVAAPTGTKASSLIFEYIQNTEKSKPGHYRTFQDLVLGSLISILLYAGDSSSISELGTRKLKNCRVFLDTNFVLSLFELHSDEFVKPAKELFGLLKKQGFPISVFDFTVDEICRVIGGYLSKANRYPITIRVDTLYSELRRKGWTKTDVHDFIINIESKLEQMDISIKTTGVELTTYQPRLPEMREKIRKYKPEQDLYHQNHDLAAIEQIKHLRGSRRRKIEDAGAIFLTADMRLSKFCFDELGHRESGTVCEAIPDRLLTTILWLKYPETEISLTSIVAMHSRELFIKRSIWDKFYEVLRQLKIEGKVSDNEIATLFLHNYIEDVLVDMAEHEVESITPEFVLAEVEKASRRTLTRFEKILRQKEQEFIQKLAEEREKAVLERDKKWQNNSKRLDMTCIKKLQNVLYVI